jgi:hypothetical protein
MPELEPEKQRYQALDYIACKNLKPYQGLNFQNFSIQYLPTKTLKPDITS